LRTTKHLCGEGQWRIDQRRFASDKQTQRAKEQKNKGERSEKKQEKNLSKN